MKGLRSSVLVLGGEGQLAQCLRLQLSATADGKEKINYHFVNRSLTPFEALSYEHLEELDRQFHPQIIINAAAYTNVDLAEDEPDLCFQVNVGATKTIVSFCAERGIKYLHFSTDYVFDGSKATPYVEQDIDSQRPLSIYGASKKASEEAVEQSGCVFAIIRTSWLYSPFRRNFFKTMEQILRVKDASVVMDQIGTPTYAIDLADVVIKITDKMMSEVNFSSAIYHYSNEGVASWYDFACAIKRHSLGNGMSLGRVLPVSGQEFKQRAKRPCYSVMSKNNIKIDLNLHIDHWEDSLIRCIKLNQIQG